MHPAEPVQNIRTPNVKGAEVVKQGMFVHVRMPQCLSIMSNRLEPINVRSVVYSPCATDLTRPGIPPIDL